MQRRTACVVATAFVLASILAVPARTGEFYPPADADALWTFITEVDPYDGWGWWPGGAGLRPGESPHGKFVAVYANGPALSAARGGMDVMPDRAIIVKENYAEDGKTLVAVTPMYRLKGYNPEGGDWFWVKYGPNGDVAAEGKVKGCISCHADVADRDWRFLRSDAAGHRRGAHHGEKKQ